MTRYFSPDETGERADDHERGETPSQRDARKARERRGGRRLRANESDRIEDFPRFAATVTGLGADKPLEMAPFATDDERDTYWKRVRELRDKRGDDGAA